MANATLDKYGTPPTVAEVFTPAATQVEAPEVPVAVTAEVETAEVPESKAAELDFAATIAELSRQLAAEKERTRLVTESTAEVVAQSKVATDGALSAKSTELAAALKRVQDFERAKSEQELNAAAEQIKPQFVGEDEFKEIGGLVDAKNKALQSRMQTQIDNLVAALAEVRGEATEAKTETRAVVQNIGRAEQIKAVNAAVPELNLLMTTDVGFQALMSTKPKGALRTVVEEIQYAAQTGQFDYIKHVVEAYQASTKKPAAVIEPSASSVMTSGGTAKVDGKSPATTSFELLAQLKRGVITKAQFDEKFKEFERSVTQI